MVAFDSRLSAYLIIDLISVAIVHSTDCHASATELAQHYIRRGDDGGESEYPQLVVHRDRSSMLHLLVELMFGFIVIKEV